MQSQNTLPVILTVIAAAEFLGLSWQGAKIDKLKDVADTELRDARADLWSARADLYVAGQEVESHKQHIEDIRSENMDLLELNLQQAQQLRDQEELIINLARQVERADTTRIEVVKRNDELASDNDVLRQRLESAHKTTRLQMSPQGCN